MSERLLGEVFAAIDAGRLDRAKALLAPALRRDASSGPLNSAMAVTLATQGLLGQAVFYAQRAVELMPDLPEAWLNLGQMLGGLGRFPEGIGAIEHGLALDPNHAEGFRRYATVLAGAHRYADALAACRRGLDLVPDDHNLLLEQGRLELLVGHAPLAVGILSSAAEHHPRSPGIARALAFAALYDPGTSRTRAFELARRCGELVASGYSPLPPRESPPCKPLRVGFISPDLRNHAVARFIEPLIEHLPPDRVRVYGYSTCIHADACTQRLRAHCETFHLVSGMTWAQTARRIRDDRIDVLIDLAGYTADSGIDVLTMRPAPVQATYLGYPGTTGMPGVGYRLVDSFTDPHDAPHRADDFATETLVRLDPCFLCYRPDDDAPLVNERDPARAVTFGCFGSGPKLSDPLLSAWARLLDRCPGSRLLLKNHSMLQSELRAALLERAGKAGLDPSRIEPMSPTPDSRSHLGAYANVDIALDTFPYAGTTTTCEALHMGVPVVSMAGVSHHERVGLSILSGVGLANLCARDHDAYVETALRLAADRPRLATLRRDLRPMLAGSVVCDAAAFARRFCAAIEAIAHARERTP